jgi:hypothetical protein
MPPKPSIAAITAMIRNISDQWSIVLCPSRTPSPHLLCRPLTGKEIFETRVAGSEGLSGSYVRHSPQPGFRWAAAFAGCSNRATHFCPLLFALPLCNEGSSLGWKTGISCKNVTDLPVWQAGIALCAQRYPQSDSGRHPILGSVRQNGSCLGTWLYHCSPSPGHCEAPEEWRGEGSTCVIVPASGLRLAPFHSRGKRNVNLIADYHHSTFR